MGEQNKMKAPSAPPVLLGLPLMQMFREEQMGRPQEMSQERFQRGADPADESQEVDMRMILEALKRDMQAAMEGEEATFNTEKEEEEPRSTSDHLKELSPYSLYK